MPWRARLDLCGGRWETSVPTAMALGNQRPYRDGHGATRAPTVTGISGGTLETWSRSLSGLTRNWREGKPSRWFWPTQHASVPGSSLGLRDFEGGSVAGVALLLPRAVLGPARALFRAR